MLTLTDAQIQFWVATFVWPFARIIGLLLADPIFAYRGVPRRFKAALALMLTIVVAPLLPVFPAVPLVSAAGMAVLAQQLLIGLAMGFAMRLVMTGIEMAGFIIGSQAGLGFAMFFDPVHSAQTPVLSQLLTLLAFLLFLSFDGHHTVLAILIESFHVLPIGVTLPPSALKGIVIWSGHILIWGVWLALPVVGALLVANLAIAVMTRAAPQFNIFSFGFPLTMLIGFISLYMALPMMASIIEQMYHAGFSLIQNLGP